MQKSTKGKDAKDLADDSDGTDQKSPTFAERTSSIDDDAGRMAIRLVVQRAGDREVVKARAAALLAPLHAGIVVVTLHRETRYVVDRGNVFVVPAGSRATVEAKSPVAHTVVLAPSAALCEHAAKTYEGEIDRGRFVLQLREPRVLPRTTWVNELVHRYLFERAVCKKTDNEATAFLETELAKELYFVTVDKAARVEAAKGRSQVVDLAVRFVDEHLFEPDVLTRIPRAAGASPSTLLRAFKRELGQGPLAYLRQRRLDESMMMLKSRRVSVGEVAALVGYKSFTAFSQAFRTRFGVRPSDVRGS